MTTQTDDQAHTIQSEAMLAAITIKMWSGKKLDRKTTREITQMKSANVSAGRFNKALLVANELTTVSELAGDIRKAHYRFTLPWTDAGARILPNELYEKYTDAIRPLIDRWEAARVDFLRNYPALILEQKTRLGDLWSEADYPTAAELQKKFLCDPEIMPIPDSDDFRVDMKDSESRRVKKSMDAQLSRQIGRAVNGCVSQFVDCLERIHAVKDFDPSKKGAERHLFKDTIRTNLETLQKIGPALNFTNDPTIDAAIKRIDSGILGEFETAQELREDPEKRQKVSTEAARILATMSGYVGSNQTEGA